MMYYCRSEDAVYDYPGGACIARSKTTILSSLFAFGSIVEPHGCSHDDGLSREVLDRRIPLSRIPYDDTSGFFLLLPPFNVLGFVEKNGRVYGKVLCVPIPLWSTGGGGTSP
jgi:hypothetical protein